ncbi:MAG: hydrolase [Desulfosporosinus sp.]|nr:hydrolase [Desulfosporosinus sp.]
MFSSLWSHLKRNKVKLLVVVIFLIMIVFVKKVLIDIVYVGQQYAKNRIITAWGEKIKSGNLSVDYSLDQTLSDIAQLGLNTVNVPVEIDIPSLTANTMSVNPESKKKAIELIRKLRYKGINVILEPYPYIKDGELYETKLKPADVNVWFWNWKQVVLSPLIKDIAKPYQVYALCIGSNFDQIETDYGYWTDVADFVRINYPGRITYKTNWWYTAKWDTQKAEQNDTYTRKLNNPVFEKVDFISVAAYFELTDKDTNTVENLVSSLYSTQIFKRQQNVFSELENLSTRWQKPVFFGELGFPRRNKAAVHPWNPLPSTIINDQEQANCFQAYKEVFEKATWNLGFSVFAIGKIDENKNYYPSEQSIGVINSWYK